MTKYTEDLISLEKDKINDEKNGSVIVYNTEITYFKFKSLLSLSL